MPRRIRGREILVVEDEPFIALDISEALETAGASVVVTNTLKEIACGFISEEFPS